jgi:hypothetical protein
LDEEGILGTHLSFGAGAFGKYLLFGCFMCTVSVVEGERQDWVVTVPADKGSVVSVESWVTVQVVNA